MSGGSDNRERPCGTPEETSRQSSGREPGGTAAGVVEPGWRLEHLCISLMTRPVRVIRPPSFSMWAMGQHLATLVQCRDLLYTLTLHRISVRYKQSVLGYFWAVLHPVLLLAIYTIIFSRLVTVPTHGVPYAIFAFSALLPWTFFSNGLSGATIGVSAQLNLILKRD